MKKRYPLIFLIFAMILIHTISNARSVALFSAQSNIAPKLGIIPIDKDSWLLKAYPKTNTTISPWAYSYPQQVLSAANLTHFEYSSQAKYESIYHQAIHTLSNRISNASHINPEMFLLLGDIHLCLALMKDNTSHLTHAQIQYKKAKQRKISPSLKMALEFNYALTLMNSKNYEAATRFMRITEKHYLHHAEYTNQLRTMIMENYYRHGRYKRAEDYLWMLANQTTAEQVSHSILSRYGDALFQRNEYEESIKWYEKYLDIILPPSKTDAAIRTSAIYYAESLFQIGKYEKAHELFKELIKLPGKFTPLFAYRIIQCQSLNDKSYFQIKKQYKRLARKYASHDVHWAALIAMHRIDFLENKHKSFATIKNTLSPIVDIAMPSSLRLAGIRLLSRILYDEDNFNKVIVLLDKSFQIDIEKNKSSIWLNDLLVATLYELYPIAKEQHTSIEFIILCLRYAEQIQLSHDSHILVYHIASAFIDSGLHGWAKRMYTRLLHRFTIDLEMKYAIQLTLANLALKNSNLDIAKTALKTIPKDDIVISNKDYIAITGRIALMESKFGLASEKLQTAIALETNAMQRQELLFDYALTLHKSGRYEESIKVLFDIIGPLEFFPSDKKHESKHNAAYLGIKSFAKSNQYSKATAFFERLKPTLIKYQMPVDTMFILIEAYRKQGKYDEASQFWNKSTENDDRFSGSFAKNYEAYLKTKRQLELVK